jgi:hypothetical protein
MKFGGKQTMQDKVAMATKKGYDTGKKSTGSKPLPKAKIKPKIGKDKVGFTITKKV